MAPEGKRLRRRAAFHGPCRGFALAAGRFFRYTLSDRKAPPARVSPTDWSLRETCADPRHLRSHHRRAPRCHQLVDEVIVAVAVSAKKKPLFSLDERVALVKEATKDLPNVRVEPFDELLVDFARRMDAQAVVKGLRAITDFEYEFQMTALNYQLDKELETLFIMSTPQHMYLSSSIVREIASLGGDVSKFVSPCVEEALRRRYAELAEAGA